MGVHINAKRAVILSAVLFPSLSLIFLILGYEALFITASAFSFHILMRLIVGYAVKNAELDGRSVIFHVSDKEFRFLRSTDIAFWKERLPTYDEESFKVRNLDALYSVMLHAELTHFLIAILSFVPFAASLCIQPIRSSWPVFFITSALSALFDSLFVAVQRYNRKRIDRLRRRA